MKKLNIIILVLVSVWLTQCGRSVVSAPAGNWVYLGDKWVNFGIDHDELFVTNVRDNFKQIALRVTDGPVHILDMKVHFDNGGVQDVPVRAMIRQGGQSRAIDLTGGYRSLQKITFWYETVGFRKGKSRVAVWGLR